MRSRLLLLLILFFLAPYAFAIVIAKFHFRLPTDFAALLGRTVLQASLSAVLAALLGGLLAMGLLRLSVRWEALAVAPAVVPSIAVVLAFMTLLPGLRGWVAIALAHGAISAGLVATVLTRIIRSSITGSCELAWCEGASRGAIWFRGVVPALREDVLRLAIAVFAASLTSFSIPLLLGGSDIASFEIAVLQAIRLDNAWDIAASLSIFQLSALMVLVLFLSKDGGSRVGACESQTRVEIGRVLGCDFAVPLLFVVPALILFSLLRVPRLGLAQLESAGLQMNSEFFVLALRGSIVTATFAGVLTAVILTAFAFAFPSEKLRRAISGYVAPSVAITGFATLIIGWGENPSFATDAIRISVGSALLFAPVLWRLRFEQRLARLSGQVQVAETLGAPFAMTFWKVLFPQIRETLFWSAGLVSFWVWGDYAIGSVAASRPMTVALVAKSLLENYRLEAASVLIVLCLLFGAISYGLFSFGGARVAD